MREYPIRRRRPRAHRRKRREAAEAAAQGKPIPPVPIETMQRHLFGTWDGVFATCILNLFGIVVFLRLGWMVGQAGIGLSFLIILLSGLVIFLTSLSMSAIATNGQIRAGGAYFLISRSVGPEIGGSVGILLIIAKAVSTALYVIGFCESLTKMIGPEGSLTGDELWDVRIYGTILTGILLGLTVRGVKWFVKTEMILLGTLVLAILWLILGTFVQDPAPTESGFHGWDGELLRENFKPDYHRFEEKNYGFFGVLAIFFPTVTGIMTGVSLSGDLREPSKSIPRGLLASVSVSTVTFLFLALMLGGTVARVVHHEVECTGFGSDPPECAGHSAGDTVMALDRTAGLIYDTLVMVEIAYRPFSRYSVLVSIGLYGTTFAGAFTGMVTTPGMLRRVAHDHLFPVLNWLAPKPPIPPPSLQLFRKRRQRTIRHPLTSDDSDSHTHHTGTGTEGEVSEASLRQQEIDYIALRRKVRGKAILRNQLVIVAVVLACVLVAQLNLIAPFISVVFMLTCAIINFACFALSVSKAPGWRPSFTWYNQYLALLGAAICLVGMFLIDVIFALAAGVFAFGLYFYIRQAEPEVNWGSALDSYQERDATNKVMALAKIKKNVKNFRPQFILFTKDSNPETSEMIKFGSTLSKAHGMLLYARVIIGDPDDPDQMALYRETFREPEGAQYIHGKTKSQINREAKLQKARERRLSAERRRLRAVADTAAAAATEVEERFDSFSSFPPRHFRRSTWSSDRNSHVSMEEFVERFEGDLPEAISAGAHWQLQQSLYWDRVGKGNIPRNDDELAAHMEAGGYRGTSTLVRSTSHDDLPPKKVPSWKRAKSNLMSWNPARLYTRNPVAMRRLREARELAAAGRSHLAPVVSSTVVLPPVPPPSHHHPVTSEIELPHLSSVTSSSAADAAAAAVGHGTMLERTNCKRKTPKMMATPRAVLEADEDKALGVMENGITDDDADVEMDDEDAGETEEEGWAAASPLVGAHSNRIHRFTARNDRYPVRPVTHRFSQQAPLTSVPENPNSPHQMPPPPSSSALLLRGRGEQRMTQRSFSHHRRRRSSSAGAERSRSDEDDEDEDDETEYGEAGEQENLADRHGTYELQEVVVDNEDTRWHFMTHFKKGSPTREDREVNPEKEEFRPSCVDSHFPSFIHSFVCSSDSFSPSFSVWSGDGKILRNSIGAKWMVSWRRSWHRVLVKALEICCSLLVLDRYDRTRPSVSPSTVAD